MNLIFKSSFERDIKKIKDKNLLQLISEAIENTERAKTIKEINDFKKLTGYKTFYRIKIKEYRIGLNIEDDNVYFVRFMHRKDIYKSFP